MTVQPSVMVWGGTRGLGKELARRSVELGSATWVAGRDPVSAKADPELAGILACDRVDFLRLGELDASDAGAADGGFYHHSIAADIIFWAVDALRIGSFGAATSNRDLFETMYAQILVPMALFRDVLDRRDAVCARPLHLVTLWDYPYSRSTAPGQVAYDTTQGAREQFARGLHKLPIGPSRSTVVRTGMWFDSDGTAAPGGCETTDVARLIWEIVSREGPRFLSANIVPWNGAIRLDAFDNDGRPITVWGKNREPIRGQR